MLNNTHAITAVGSLEKSLTPRSQTKVVIAAGPRRKLSALIAQVVFEWHHRRQDAVVIELPLLLPLPLLCFCGAAKVLLDGHPETCRPKMHNQSWPLVLLTQMKIVVMLSHGSYLYFNLLDGKVFGCLHAPPWRRQPLGLMKFRIRTAKCTYLCTCPQKNVYACIYL